MAGRGPEAEQLLTPAEVAALFRVDPKTVTRWAKAGKLTSIRTLGGHRRYRADEVQARCCRCRARRPANCAPDPAASDPQRAVKAATAVGRVG